MNQQQPTPPIKKFCVRGRIEAAIWQNQVEQNGRPVVQYSIKVQRSYKDKDSGEWKTTDYFRPQDLPSLALVAQEASASPGFSSSNWTMRWKSALASAMLPWDL